MSYCSASDSNSKPPVSLVPLRESDLSEWQQSATTNQRQWLEVSGFKASPGQFCFLPDAENKVRSLVFGMQEKGWLGQLSALVSKLPEGVYQLHCEWSREQRLQASLGWGLASYRFDRYKKSKKPQPTLLLDEDIETSLRKRSLAFGGQPHRRR